MTTTTQITRWALLADERRARLITVDRNPNGFVRVTEQMAIESEQVEHQHGRPSPLKGKDAHTHASFPDEDPALRRRFAKKVAEWAERESGKAGVGRLEVFSPARFLSDLRGEWSNQAPVSEETQHQAEITHLDTGHLTNHKLIKGLLERRAV